MDGLGVFHKPFGLICSSHGWLLKIVYVDVSIGVTGIESPVYIPP